MPNENHTQAQYMSLAQAFDYLNQTLFQGTLPSALVTFQRRANSRGHYSPGSFEARGDATITTDEIALNPDAFEGRTDEQIFSTLAHEMAHLWQQVHGKAPTRAYHDKQWAAKMEEIGLMPSDTGMPGGKKTGARVTHYIIPGGAFSQSYEALRQRGILISWQSAPRDPLAKSKLNSKTKYTCGLCGQNAWAKPNAEISCTPCDAPMFPDAPSTETTDESEPQ